MTLRDVLVSLRWHFLAHLGVASLRKAKLTAFAKSTGRECLVTAAFLHGDE